jgi:hypothetical protein
MQHVPTAVLIHGCHLEAEGWEDIVWGDPAQGRLGRVPYGLFKAMELRADMIIFGTGASEREGLKEGRYTYRYAMERLPEFLRSAGVPHEHWFVTKHWTESVTKLELTSQNTREEVLAAAHMAHKAGIKRLILVSSPEHIMRCHQAALSVLGTAVDLRFFLDELYATASHTHFKDATVDDVVIVEPPHRGDTPKVPFYRTIKRIFATMRKPEVAFKLDAALNKAIDEHVAML